VGKLGRKLQQRNCINQNTKWISTKICSWLELFLLVKTDARAWAGKEKNNVKKIIKLWKTRGENILRIKIWHFRLLDR